MKAVIEQYGRVERFVEDRRVPTWLLGPIVSLLAWKPLFALPSPGLDVSWWAGLYMAAHEGFGFGTDVVFTYGPLGFMRLPWLFYGDLAVIAYLYSAAVYIAFVSALVWTLRDRVGAPVACLLTFLVAGLVPGIDLAIAVAVLWALAVLSERPPRHSLNLLLTVGAVFAAAEGLMKLSSGPVVFGVLLIGLIGARAKLWQIATFLGTYLFSYLLLWILAGQALGDLPDFFVNSLQVTAGYAEAMARYIEPATVLPLVLISVAFVLVWAWFGEFRDERARYAGFAVVLLVGAAMYKQGVIRTDAPHLAIFYSMMMVLVIAVPAGRRRLPAMFFLAAAFSVASIHLVTPGSNGGIDVVGNVEGAGRDARTLVSPNRQQQTIAERRFGMQLAYAIEPAQLRQLEGRSVIVEPFEIGAAWAYELDWDPLPVFRSVLASTPELDDLNSSALADDSGPDRILRAVSTDPSLPGAGLDGRFLGWDPPRQSVEALCNFWPISESDDWQVLSRVDDRCGPMIPAGIVEAEFDQAVAVPRPEPDEVVLARIAGAEVQGLERIRSLLYKPKARYAVTSDGRSYRFIGATAEQGIMLRSGRFIAEGRGPFAQIPQTPTLELTGQTGDLTFEFFRMKVDSGPAQSAK